MTTRPAPPVEDARRRTRLVDRLLRLPLLWKILVANGVVVAVGAVVGATLVASLVRADPDRSMLALVLVLGAAGTAASVLVNAVILKVALSPLREIEDAAREVEAGAFDARARISPVADRDLARLAHVLNEMLDRLDHHRARLGRLAGRSLRAAEEERKRVSRELHDDAAQRLAALMVRLRNVRRDVVDDTASRRLEGFRDELEETLESIRGYARGLRPPALDDVGIDAAIGGLARRTGELGVEVDVRSDGPFRNLGEDAELALYRMIQEALSNVVRHSGASRATVELLREPGAVVVLVRDEGRGFEVEEEFEGGAGLGLLGLSERAEYVGGSVSIESEPGHGTTIRIEVPVKAGRDDERSP